MRIIVPPYDRLRLVASYGTLTKRRELSLVHTPDKLNLGRDLGGVRMQPWLKGL